MALVIEIQQTLNIISNNPYRQLGVYSTSSQRDIVANQGKMKAFLKVGRSVTFPLDLQGVLPAIARNENSVAEATSKLTLPAEQLKYAQFWFAKCTQIDEIACGKLTTSDIDGAIEIWNKKQTVSSLQNLLVCSLIKNQLGNAISYAQNLYTSFSNEFVQMVLGENALATSDNLAHDFLDVLCDEYKPYQFLEFITNQEWKEYVCNKSTKPLIDRISSAIDVCKSSRGKGVIARYNAGTKLMNNTKADLSQLKRFLSSNALQYQMIADKLGLEILQCGIDYYSDSTEQDAAHKAMTLQKYAQSIVVGKMAKDRCKENVDILHRIIAELPPSEVFTEDRAIKEELRKFTRLPDRISYSMDLLNNTKPHLQSIKSKLGSSNGYYLKISTQVVGNALHNVIEEVNALQNDSNFKLNMILDKAAALSSLKSVLRSAWSATTLMDSFDMESDFKTNRYNENKRTLSNMCSQVGVSTYSSSSSYGTFSRTSSSSSSSTSSSSSSSDDKGCAIAFISIFICVISGAIISTLYNKNISKEDIKQNTEYVASKTSKISNDYLDLDSDYIPITPDNVTEESCSVDSDYDTYIDNQLKTGSKPYKDYYNSRTGDNYLDFKTSGNDYVVIVRDYSSSEVVNHIYIRAGDKGRLYLPNGTYNIYFYGGKGWNPNMKNGNVIGGFISSGHIQKDGPIELYNQYGEYTLYPVQNGNLQLQEASKEEAL